MDVAATLRVLLDASRLKRTPRTGWVVRGVSDAESVAGHCFGVAFVTLILAEFVEHSFDRAKLLTIALLHDLPESVIGDLAAPAVAHFPPGAKLHAEREALVKLLHGLPHADQWRAWWREYEKGTSVEGRLVRDADKLDMLIQAHIYEQTTGNRWISEFWPGPEAPPFEFAASQALYEALLALREQPRGARDR